MITDQFVFCSICNCTWSSCNNWILCFILLRFPASPWTSVCHQAASPSPAMGSSFRWGLIQGQMSDIIL